MCHHLPVLCGAVHCGARTYICHTWVVLQNHILVVGVCPPICSCSCSKGPWPALGFILPPCCIPGLSQLEQISAAPAGLLGFIGTFRDLSLKKTIRGEKTWNEARGNFFIRFLLHKMCRVKNRKSWVLCQITFLPPSASQCFLSQQ